jgi:hypothetical protein
MIKELWSFVKSIFSEDGQGSFSRMAQGFIVLMTCGWVTHVVWKTHAIPDLGGVSVFIGTGALGHYGLNKAESIVGAFRGKNTDSGQGKDGQ